MSLPPQRCACNIASQLFTGIISWHCWGIVGHSAAGIPLPQPCGTFSKIRGTVSTKLTNIPVPNSLLILLFQQPWLCLFVCVHDPGLVHISKSGLSLMNSTLFLMKSGGATPLGKLLGCSYLLLANFFLRIMCACVHVHGCVCIATKKHKNNYIFC